MRDSESIVVAPDRSQLRVPDAYMNCFKLTKGDETFRSISRTDLICPEILTVAKAVNNVCKQLEKTHGFEPKQNKA